MRSDSPFPRRIPWAERSRADKLISVWISNCALDTMHRLDVAEDLDAAGVHFASYGECLHNSDQRGWQSLLQVGATEGVRNAHKFLARTRMPPSQKDQDMYDTSAKHPFFFAAENSDCAYYHTEKVYHGLLSGSIPVYLGNSHTIDAFVPRGSIIKAADFNSTE